jgi:hypothetical protein
MKMKATIIFCHLLLAAPIMLFAQGITDGFMRGAGNTDLALTVSYESFSSYYVGRERVTNENLGTVMTQSANLYLATGLTNFLDLIVALPYIQAAPSTGYWPAQQGFQDLSFYLKLRLLEKDLGKNRFSAMAAGGITTPLSDYVADAPVAIGHQATAYDVRMIVQWFHQNGYFASAQAGYFRRENITIDRGFEVLVPDAADFSVKAGMARATYYLETWIHHRASRPGTDIGPGVPFPTNEISFTRAGLSAYVPIPWVKRLGATTGMAVTLNGRNVGHTTRWHGGLVYGLPSWKK